MSDSSKAVFLSYASQDAEAAKRICDALRQAGVEVWFDQSELRGGDAWDQSIRKQIKACALFVPVISANTQARSEGYFRLEWKLADDRTHLMARGTRFILPVCVDDTKDWDAIVPDSFTTVQWTRLPAGEGATGFAERAKKLLSPEPGAGSPSTSSGPGGREMEAGRSRPAMAGSGDPALQMRRRPIWPWIVAAIVALPVLYFIFKPRRSPEEIAKIIAEAQKMAAEATKTTTATAPLTEARQLVAKAWEQMNKPELARAEVETADGFCKRATELDSNDADAWAAWSQVDSWSVYHNYDRSPARREAARTKAARALQLAPNSYEARLAQACQLLRAGGGQSASLFDAQADGLLRALLRENQDEPRALLALGILLRNSGKFDEVREVFGRLVKNPAFAAQGWNELGWAEWFAGDYRAAEAASDKSIALRSFWGNLGLKTRIAQIWWGDLDLAKATLDRFSASDRQEDRGIFFSSSLYYWRREPEAMLQVLSSVPRDWMQLNGFDGPKAYWAALAHRMAGHGEAAKIQWQAALKLVERQLADSPDSSQLIHWKGVLLAESGNRAEAETALRLAREMGNASSSNVSAYDEILLGNLDAAIALLERQVDERTRGVTAAAFRLNPIYDPLRKEPRLQALLARMEADPRFSPKATAVLAPSLPQSLTPPDRPPVADQKSVAVLAFANLSDDKGNEYFSDGISEELLTVLQKIPGLHVAARTSAFSFKGKNATAQEIGRQLSVAHLVEGSVQKSGSRVKITARLSRVATGEELWSKSYTREVKDVFALQEELALAIVGELRGQLPGGESAAAIKAAVKGGTTNPEAYQQHLQGRYFFNRHAEKSVGEGLAFFQRAVELDPAFALAWAGLSRAHGWLCNFSTELGREGFNAHLAAARAAADHALALEPNLPEALLARAELQLNFDYDWNGAGESLRAALTLAPADPALVIASGNLANTRGDVTGSIALLRRAVALDPVNPVARSYLAFSLATYGSLAEAEAEYPRVVELNPAAPWAHAGLGVAYLLAGKYEQAAAAAQDDSAEWARLLIVSMARFAQKRIPEADVALARLTEGFADTAAYQLAEVYGFRGETDRAFEWLERAYRQRDGGVISTKTDPFFSKLHADPRWDTFLRKLGLADDQLK